MTELKLQHKKTGSGGKRSGGTIYHPPLPSIILWLLVVAFALFLMSSWYNSVDGQWSEYGPFGSCSVSCGGSSSSIRGTMERKRACTDPEPTGLGAPCIGLDVEVHTCSANVSCSGVTNIPTPRESSCAYLQGRSGIVTSPDFPNPYSPNLDVCTVISVPQGMRLQRDQSGDSVTLYDGSLLTSPIIARLQSSSAGIDGLFLSGFTSLGSSMTVRLVSLASPCYVAYGSGVEDYDDNNCRFRLNFTAFSFARSTKGGK